MCISLKFYTRRGQMLTLSLCRSDLLFFERMRVTSLPGYLSLSRSFFFVGNSQSAHSLFLCVFCRKKGEHAQPFFFSEDPNLPVSGLIRLRAKLSLLAQREQKKDRTTTKIVRETTTTLFFLLSSFPHTRF